MLAVLRRAWQDAQPGGPAAVGYGVECAERRESATPMTAASVEAAMRNGIGLSAKPWPDAVNSSASAPPRASGTAVEHQRPTRFAANAVTSINTTRLTVGTIVPDSPRRHGLDPRVTSPEASAGR